MNSKLHLASCPLGTRLAVACLLALPAVALASGPMGHFIKSSHTVRQITSGQLDVPNELKQLLRDPANQRAFNGGSIGPDLVESASHYGNTADLANRMLATARANLHRSAQIRDQAAFNESQRELAFAYGWMHHMAADLNTHPKVNERIGDTYRFLDDGGKLSHGTLETQETAYLRQTLWNPADKYDTYVPANFLAGVTGVKASAILQMDGVLRGKAQAEMVGSGNVTLSHDQLRDLWETTVRNGQHEASDFLRNPGLMRNWDLDCGHIDTKAFDALRRKVLALHGGKLPANWGRDYLDWYRQLLTTPPRLMVAKLRELMGLPPVAPPQPAPATTSYFPSGSGSTSGTFPEGDGDFNGLKINYSVSGISVTQTKDTGDFTTTRAITGNLGSSELRVSGTAIGRDAKCKTEYGDFYRTLNVVVTAGGNEKKFQAPLPDACDKSSKDYTFNVGVPIPANARSGSFSITFTYINPRFDNRSLVVSGKMTR